MWTKINLFDQSWDYRLKFSYTNKFHGNSFEIRTVLFDKIRNIISELSFKQKSLIIYFRKKKSFYFCILKLVYLKHVLNFLYYFFAGISNEKQALKKRSHSNEIASIHLT
jgi:hypothetical protein